MSHSDNEPSVTSGDVHDRPHLAWIDETEHADDYESHLRPELLPGLSQRKGFRGSYLLRRVAGDEVEFITIILWDSLDDVRAIAGHDYEKAVIPDERLPLLSHYDAKAVHYEVVSTNEPTPT